MLEEGKAGLFLGALVGATIGAVLVFAIFSRASALRHYATATPFNQFSIPPEATTGADGWVGFGSSGFRASLSAASRD